MFTKLRELWRSLTNVKSQTNLDYSKNEELISRWQLENTPFWILRENEQFNIVLGKYRINEEPLTSKIECELYLNNNTWKVVTQICIIVMNDIQKEQQSQQKKSRV